MILKGILAIGIGWGALYAAQHYWLQMITAQVAQTPPSQLFAPPPTLPAMEIDPDQSRLAINPPAVIDTRPAQRAAAEGMIRQIELQHQAIQSYTPRPMNIPGLHH